MIKPLVYKGVIYLRYYVMKFIFFIKRIVIIILDKQKWGLCLLAYLLSTLSFSQTKFDLEEFEDLELQSLDTKKKNLTSNNKNQRLILFDDNLYLLDDEFEFGEDEFELQKLELNPQDMETAKEYENFLNVFFNNSTNLSINSFQQPPSQSNDQYTNSGSITKNNSGSITKNKLQPSKKTQQRVANKNPQTTPSYRPPRGTLGFGLSTIGGLTIPVTMTGYTSGTNFGLRFDTPVSFNVAGQEANAGIDIYFSSFNAENGGKFIINNFVANVSVFPFQSIEFRTGLGLTPLHIGDNSVTALSIPFDFNYYLPVDLSGFRFAFNLHAQRALGYPSIPGSSSGDTTDFIYLGMLINTPLVF